MTDTATPIWRTSSYTSNGESCVEVAPTAHAVLVRDTKDQGTGPTLRVSHADWAAWLAGSPIPALTVAEAEQATRHAGQPATTHWHLSDETGATLHFTAAEWAAFWAGADDGEFRFPVLATR